MTKMEALDTGGSTRRYKVSFTKKVLSNGTEQGRGGGRCPLFSRVTWERAPAPVCPSVKARPPRKLRKTAPRTVPRLQQAL